MNDKTQAIKSLEFPEVKVYEAKGKKVSFFTKGKLEVIYVPSLDRFIFRLNNFKYCLSQSLPVLASAPKDEAFRSYVMPNMGGYYMIKVRADSNPILIKNLEMIFANYSEFSYKPGHEPHEEEEPEKPADIKEAPEVLEFKEAPESEEKVRSFGGGPLVLGEEIVEQPPKSAGKKGNVGGFFKQNFAKAALFIGKGLKSKSRGKSIEKTLSESSEMSIDELKGISETCDIIEADLPKYEVSALITLSNEIEKVALDQIEQLEKEEERLAKIQDPNQKKPWPAFKQSAVKSAKSLWQGMDDALSTLSKAIKSKQAKKETGDEENAKVEESINSVSDIDEPHQEDIQHLEEDRREVQEEEAQNLSEEEDAMIRVSLTDEAQQERREVDKDITKANKEGSQRQDGMEQVRGGMENVSLESTNVQDLVNAGDYSQAA